MKEYDICYKFKGLNVFLKPMPIKISFNLCSFDTSCTFLGSQSKTYTHSTLQEAIQHDLTFISGDAGTQTLKALHATSERRFRSTILLTDGNIDREHFSPVLMNQLRKRKKAFGHSPLESAVNVQYDRRVSIPTCYC